jgi:acetolactate synthase-1/2/3 large subunit
MENEKQGRVGVISNNRTNMLSGARFIAETFKGYGVTHVFFVEAILRGALVEMESLGIRRILTHSEKAAAYMADGYARVSRSPGVCMAQSVGAANLASGLQDPYLGHSPVIGITGRKDPISRYRNAYQEILHHPMFDNVTKYNVCVDAAEQLPYSLRQAFREATSGAPGPVHIDVPGHVGQTTDKFEVDSEVVIEERYTRYPAYRPEPEFEYLRRTAQALHDSERAVIVSGGGAVASGACPDIVKLAEILSIPVATSLNGRGTIQDNHPLSVGVVGAYCRGCANKVVSEADLVLFIGTGTGDMVTNNWTLPRKGTPVIQIDINPAELGRNYPDVIGVVGDARVTVRRLLEFLDGKHRKVEWTLHAEEIVGEWRKHMEPLRNSDARPIRPERLCKEITDVLPPNAILVADTGYSSIWTCSAVDLNYPGQTYIRAAGSLGWALPASLGAKCAAPGRPVFCFTGDGGFWYHLSELETAARFGINTITVVNNNGCMSQCSEGVGKAYGDKPGNKGDLFRFRGTDFARIAHELGCLGIRVEDPGEIGRVLKSALDADTPVVVDVVTDENCRAEWKPAY